MNDATPGRISIRPAARDDVPLILSLVRELAEYERSADQVVATAESLERHLFADNFGRGPIAECLIGELDGEPQGFALYFMNFSTWLAASGIYLEDLFVRPGSRGRGLGRALLARLARIACERGCGRLEWAVLNWNAPAIGFYTALGAVPLSEWTVFRLSGDALSAMASVR